jgi:hypothetical protein
MPECAQAPDCNPSVVVNDERCEAHRQRGGHQHGPCRGNRDKPRGDALRKNQQAEFAGLGGTVAARSAFNLS